MASLFDSSNVAYQPRPSKYFQPQRIILTRGWDRTAGQRSMAEGIIAVYPKAEIIDQSYRAHNRVDLGQQDQLEAHYQGKKTLVLGVHKSALRFSEEADNTCPNYWHFSSYGFCPFDCKYCYLAGTPGVKFSPTVKIYLNINGILDQIEKTAARLHEPTPFYLGKLQDGLVLDGLTGYSRLLVPFFAEQEYARQILLTKSSDVGNLLDLSHHEHTVLSWSLNPPEVSEAFEENVPPIADRIKAMQKCAHAGYPVRAVIMPIIPIEGWQDVYGAFVGELLKTVGLQRITLGQICSYSSAMQLTERKLGKCNAISDKLEKCKSPDGRKRFPADLRTKVYRHLVSTIRTIDPDMEIGLCLEESAIFDALGMKNAIGCCNCVL